MSANYEKTSVGMTRRNALKVSGLALGGWPAALTAGSGETEPERISRKDIQEGGQHEKVISFIYARLHSDLL